MHTPPSSSAMVWVPQQAKPQLEPFASQPILAAEVAGDDPIQGLVMNAMAATLGMGGVMLLGGGVLPLCLAGVGAAVMIANDYWLQIKRISEYVDPDADPQPSPEPTYPEPAPAPVQAVAVDELQWSADEISEEAAIAQSVTIAPPPIETPEQQQAKAFAAQFLSVGMAWSAMQLDVSYPGLGVEKWAIALSNLAIRLPQDYLWDDSTKILIKRI